MLILALITLTLYLLCILLCMHVFIKTVLKHHTHTGVHT